METLIGTGGWAYFSVPGSDPLRSYSKAFEFVEVNSTFYEYPELEQVRTWRERVPSNFQFAVRCHQDLTHGYNLEPTEKAFDSFDHTLEISAALKAEFIVLQTPRSLELGSRKVALIRDFFGSVEIKNLRIVWEIRRHEGDKSLPENLIKLLEDKNIIHCTDISQEPPQVESNIIYSRLFGGGEHNVYQFTDEELDEISRPLGGDDLEKVVLSFHTVKMFKDAARLKVYQSTGEFPMATSATGLESLRAVLAEDAKLPATRAELIKGQGWKVMDLTEKRRVRVEEILNKLPEGRYSNIHEVVNGIELG